MFDPLPVGVIQKLFEACTPVAEPEPELADKEPPNTVGDVFSEDESDRPSNVHRANVVCPESWPLNRPGSKIKNRSGFFITSS